MLHLNAKMVFVCLTALLFVVACADKTQEIEEVTLNVTGMT